MLQAEEQLSAKILRPEQAWYIRGMTKKPVWLEWSK